MTKEKFWLMKSERDQLLLGSQGFAIFYSHFIHTFKRNLKINKMQDVFTIATLNLYFHMIYISQLII